MLRIWNAMFVGIGGLGTITLKRVLEYAALKEPKIKKIIGAEKHGLAQREGSVDVYVRFLLADDDDQVPEYYLTSPTIGIGEANLVIGLEPVEVLRNSKYTSDQTFFVINTNTIPPPSSISGLFKYPNIEEIKNAIQEISGSTKIIMFNATELAIQKMGQAIFANNIMLGAAIATGTIPIQKDKIESTITEQLKDSINNIKAINIGYDLGIELISKLK
ncbi:MAG: 2-oxoacid:acceptor oxidoreductase family protein [Candidatus Helarchaeota archaeon]